MISEMKFVGEDVSAWVIHWVGLKRLSTGVHAAERCGSRLVVGLLVLMPLRPGWANGTCWEPCPAELES